MAYRLNGTSRGRRDGYLARVTRRTHYVFMVDKSYSMLGDISDNFSNIHAELLDTLECNTPDALISLATFSDYPSWVYKEVPISEAPSLDLIPDGGTELDRAIMTGLTEVVTAHRQATEDITVVIVTDLGICLMRDKTNRWIDDMRALGVRFLYLVAGMMLETARFGYVGTGIRPEEVRVWGHSAEGLTKAFKEVGDILTLGSTAGSTLDQEAQLVALPPHRPL